MNSTAFSLLANSSPKVDRSQEVELTIRSMSILIGPSGSSHLSESTKPDPSASKPEAKEALESSEGSSSEVNSPVSLEKALIAESDKIQEKFDSEEKSVSDAQQRKGLRHRKQRRLQSTSVMRYYH
jgi:hypothetical protein